MRDLTAEAAEQNKSTYKPHQSKTKTLETCSWDDDSVKVCFSAPLYLSLIIVCGGSEKVEEVLHKSDYDGGGRTKTKARAIETTVVSAALRCWREQSYVFLPCQQREKSDQITRSHLDAEVNR